MNRHTVLYSGFAAFVLATFLFSQTVSAADLEEDAERDAVVEDEADINQDVLDDETNWQNDEEDIVEVDETAEVNGTDTLDGDIQLFADDPKDESDGVPDGYTGFWKEPETGDWYYCINGSIDISTTDVIQGVVDGRSGWWNVVDGKVMEGETVAHNSNGWWYINSDGMVDFSYQGFAQNENGWWYLENGKVSFDTNSVIQDTNKKIDTTADWYYVVRSQVQENFTGLADYSNANGWWYINDGKVTFDVETVAQNKNGVWYVKDSKVDFSYNGFAQDDNDWWYIEDGAVTYSKNSVIQDTNNKIDDTAGWWYVVGSQVQTGFTGLADYSNANGWWYINDGKVTFNVETVAQNKNGWWYVKDSKVDFSYNGFAENENGCWYIEDGTVTFNKNSVIQDTNKKVDDTASWWYVIGSKIQTDFTGLADYSNANGWWYINDGKVTFDVNTVAENKNGWWYVEDSKVIFNYNGFAQNSNGLWYIESGKVTFNKNSVIQDTNKKIDDTAGWWYVVGSKVQTGFTGLGDYGNGNGWWYIESGKVDFTYQGFAKNCNGWWYLEDGKVIFSKNSVIQGTVNGTNAWWYVVGGQVQTSFTGLADYSNENGWWYIKNGQVDFTHNGVDQNKNGWWYVTDGKVQFGFTGLADYANSNGWWYINSGKVDFSVNTIAKNINGWWYVKNGKVDFSAGDYSFAADTSQILDVQASGNTGTLTMFNKNGNSFTKVSSQSCYVGKNGVTSNKIQGDKKTPAGVYTLGQAFGVASDPGCTRDYLKLNQYYYWVGDSSSKYYNQLVDSRVTGIVWNEAEHLIDYPVAYKYAIAIDYNTSQTPNKGSAIFLHCSTGGSTAGCVSVSESYMVTILKSLTSDTRIYIHNI